MQIESPEAPGTPSKEQIRANNQQEIVNTMGRTERCSENQSAGIELPLDILFAGMVVAWLPWGVSAYSTSAPSALGWRHFVAIAVTTTALLLLRRLAKAPQRWSIGTWFKAKAHLTAAVLRDGGPATSGKLATHESRELNPMLRSPGQALGREIAELRSQIDLLTLLVSIGLDVDGACSKRTLAAIGANLRGAIVSSAAVYRMLTAPNVQGSLAEAGVFVSLDTLAQARHDIAMISDALRMLHNRWLGESAEGAALLRQIDALEAASASYGVVERLFFHNTVLLAEVADLTGALAEDCERQRHLRALARLETQDVSDFEDSRAEGLNRQASGSGDTLN